MDQAPSAVDSCACTKGRAVRRAPFLLLAAALSAAVTALAGPVDPRHRLEHVGPAATDAVTILGAPGTGHAIVLHRSGELRLTRGAGLPGRLVTNVPVGSSCAAHGLLDGAWDPTAPGRTLFVTYTAATTRALAVGRVDIATGQFTQVYTTGIAAGCENVGGGLAFGDDGMLFLGLGDMGQPSQAAQLTAKAGKIYRMTTAGRAPTAPAALNPILPTSLVYAFGVRNPVRLAADAATGDTWFLDVGPGDDDELNLLVPGVNFGWDDTLTMGHRFTAGMEDPYFVWSPGIEPSGLAVYAGANLDQDLVGKLIVSAGASGRLSAVTPNLTIRDQSTEEVLLAPDASGPQGFVAMTEFEDGALYLIDDVGDVQRFLSSRGPLVEPSSVDGMLPLTLRKVGGQVEIVVERAPGVDDYGLHVGDVMTLTTTGYSHDDQPATYVSAPAEDSEAVARLLVPMSALGAPGANTYVLLSARRTCAETILGASSIGDDRPMSRTTCTVQVLGGGSHDINDVEVTEILGPAGRLDLPRDLAFHPDVPEQLWVINQGDNSTVIITNPHTPQQTSIRKWGNGADHFFSRPAALAFGPGTGFFASIHEEDQPTQGTLTDPDFMGPTLWTSDSVEYEGGHASHYDMLHNSPNGVGIAWEVGNAYWVYDGYHLSLTRYDFVNHHGPAGQDHSDGIITRYAEGDVSYVPDVSSHVIYDHDRRLVYASDTGNARVVALDPSTGTNVGPTSPNYDCPDDSQTKVNGALTWTLIDGSLHGLVAPSGIELHDGLLFVSDNSTSKIFAFTLDGELVDWLDTGFPTGTLMGMAFDPRDGSLYVVDTRTDRVIRIAALP